jgi:hypothetical protein
VRATRLAVAAALAWATTCGTGCTPPRGGWDWDALGARHPAVREVRGSRLGDATPYVVPRAEELILFLCRWSTERPLSVALPPDASPRERALLRLALRSWEEAGLGVRFEERESAPADIEIVFVEPDPEQDVAAVRSGLVTADCAVEGDLRSPLAGERVEAELAHAEIRLARAVLDLLGRPVALGEERLLGTALHELGHALGYQGHAARGSVMTRSVSDVRWIGGDVLEGGSFRDPTLHSLYLVPSGTVVGRLPIQRRRLRPARRLARIGSGEGWSGPWVRVGERLSVLWWRDPLGNEVRLLVPRGGELSWPEDWILIPDEPARLWLSGFRPRAAPSDEPSAGPSESPAAAPSDEPQAAPSDEPQAPPRETS